MWADKYGNRRHDDEEYDAPHNFVPIRQPHSPAVPESAPICGNYAEYVGDGIGCDKDKGHEGNCGKKVSGAEPSRREP